jgi:hypothetical protein
MHNPSPIHLDADYIIHLGRVQQEEKVTCTTDVKLLRGRAAVATRADIYRPGIMESNLSGTPMTGLSASGLSALVSTVTQDADDADSAGVASYLVWEIHGARGIATTPGANQAIRHGCVGPDEFRQMIRNLFVAVAAHAQHYHHVAAYPPRVVLCHTFPSAESSMEFDVRDGLSCSAQMQAAVLLEESQEALGSQQADEITILDFAAPRGAPSLQHNRHAHEQLLRGPIPQLLTDELPILPLDTILPKQRLQFRCPSELRERYGFEVGKRYGMVGMQRSSHAQLTGHGTIVGTEVLVTKMDSDSGSIAASDCDVELVAQRLFEADAQRGRADNTLVGLHPMVGRVKKVPVVWIDLCAAENSPTSFQASRQLGPLVRQWIATIRSRELEQQPVTS